MTDYIRAKYYKRAFLVTLALFAVACAWIAFHAAPHQPPQPEEVIKHDTLWRDTTLHAPTPTATIQTGRTIYIPYILSETDTIEAHDTLLVQVPIEQRRYDDSLYTAWVSGYQPQLDSLLLHRPEVVTTIERTIVKPAPRWSIGPSVGAGISITGEQRAGIYLGFTAQYRLWPK